jgi:hypothetical protein
VNGVPGAGGELASRRWSTSDDLGDLVERIPEHVVQQKELRSAGESHSSTTSSAMLTDSSRSTLPAGSTAPGSA